MTKRTRWRLALLTVAALAALASATNSYQAPGAPAPGAPVPIGPDTKPPVSPPARRPPTLPPRTILFLGVDARREDPGRSDTTMVVRVDEARRELRLLAVPRDTRALIPGRGLDKVNAAYAYGGPALAVRTISRLLGISIDYYVVLDTGAVPEVVDALGGVNIDVEAPMYYNDPADGLHIALAKGPQRLNGDQAAQYLRFRTEPEGDIARVKRQQRFVQELLRHALRPSTLGQLPRLLAIAGRRFSTNIPPGEQLRVAMAVYNARETILTRVLPGEARYIEDLSYWIVDPAEARRVARWYLCPDSSPLPE